MSTREGDLLARVQRRKALHDRVAARKQAVEARGSLTARAVDRAFRDQPTTRVADSSPAIERPTVGRRAGPGSAGVPRGMPARAGGPGVQTPSRSLESPTMPGDRVTDTIRDVTNAVARGASEVGHRTAIGVTELVGADKAAANLRASRELGRETYGESETVPGKIAEGLTQLAGEGALFMIPGAGASRAAGALSRAGKANRFLNLLARPVGLRQRVAQNLITGAPIDLAISQAGAEDSLTGAAAALTGSETLERASRNPAARGAIDVAAGFGMSTVIGEAIEAVARRRARRTPTRQDAPGSSTGTPEATQPRVGVTESPLPPAAAAPDASAAPLPDLETRVAERKRVLEAEGRPSTDPQTRVTEGAPAPSSWRERAVEPPTRGRRQRTHFPGDESKVETEYAVLEADEIRASHTPTYAQRPAEEFPPEIQGRAYHGPRGQQAREHTERIVSQFDPERALDPTVSAADGPPVITAQGINVAGNGRTIAQQRLYQSNPERAQQLRDELVRRAAEFGVDPDVVRGMRNPVLVRRIVDAGVDVSDANVLRRLNQASDVPTGKAKDVGSDAMTRATQFRSATRAISHFTETAAEDATIRSYLGTGDGREFMRRLVEDGVISSSERARFIDAAAGTPTDEGKQLVERMFYAAAIGDADVVARAPEGILRKLDTALPGLIRATQVEGWDVGGLVREALDLLSSARAQNMGLDDLVAQVDLTRPAPPKNVVDMARFLDRSPKAEIRDAFRAYADEAESFGRQTASEDMFGHQPKGAGEARGRFAALSPRQGRRQALDRLLGRERAAERHMRAMQSGRAHPLEPMRDLFGEEVQRGAAQGELLGRGPQGMSEALNQARATASSLEAKVKRGSASADEVRRYQEARSLIRRSEGRGLDAGELDRQRSTSAPAPKQPDDTRDMFALAPRDRKVEAGQRARVRVASTDADFDVLDEGDIVEVLSIEDGLAEIRVGKGTPAEQVFDDIPVEALEPLPLQPRGREPTVPFGTRTRASEMLPAAGKFSDTPGGAAVESPVAIVRELNDAIDKALEGVKLGEGRFPASVRGALGIIKPRSQVIRLKDLSEAPVFGHEAGHAMQKLMFGSVDGGLSDEQLLMLPGAVRGELEDMAQGISDESLKEGWAEFWRRYLDNPQALDEQAPNALKYIEGRLEEFPEVREAWQLARQDWTAFRESSAQARVDSKISVGDREADVLSIGDRWSRFRTAVLDDFEPIRRVVDHIREKAGIETIAEDAETLARLSRGSVGIANMFLEHGAIDFRTLRRTGPGLKQVLKPVTTQLDDFRRYMVARRAKELHARRITTGFRPEDVDATVRQLEEKFGSTFKPAFDGLQQWNRSLLEYLRDAGVLSPRTYDAIVEKNLDYVPFYRVREGRGVGGSMGQNFGHLFNPTRRIRGSGRDIIDPLESMVKNAMIYTQIAQRQQVSAALARLAEKEGVGKILEEFGTPIRPTQFKLGEIEGQLTDAVPGLDRILKEIRKEAKAQFDEVTSGLSAAEKAELVQYDPAEELLAIFRPGDFFGKPNMISVLEGGRRRWYEVDPELYAALEGLDREHLDAFARYLGTPARTLRAGATLAPEFLIRNPLRDQVMAFIQSEYGYKPFVDMARGAFELMRKGEAYQQWISAGGYRAALTSLDRDSMQNGLRQLTQSGGMQNVVKNPLDALRAMSAVMEDATRMGEFLNARRVHGTSKEGLQTAAAASREISIDFARHGAKTAFLRHVAAFWNARLQGYDRLARAARRNPGKFAATAFSAITLPSLLEYASNYDDPEYWEQPQWKRDLFWMVRVGDDWLSIPKPFELGLVFGTLPVRVLDSVVGGPGGSEEIRRFLGDTMVREATGMVPFPTAVEPLVENATNYSFFLRRPITPRSEQEVRDRLQGGEGVSEVAQMLARWSPGEEGVSPRTIDNLLFAWTGGLGRLGTESLEPVLGRGEPASPSRRVSDLPGIRGVMDPSPGFSSESVERFYRQYERARGAVSTLNYLDRTENRAEYDREIANTEASELRSMEPSLRRAADELAEIRAAADAIRRDPDMSADEKREQLDELGREATEVARSALGRELPGSR